jgi:hypothetical protein
LLEVSGLRIVRKQLAQRVNRRQRILGRHHASFG